MISLLLAAALNAMPVQARSEPTPRNSPATWITWQDYPSEALRAEQQGDVGFTLTVDATGRVSDCSITKSSGHLALDRTTCALLRRRARFIPASDSAGVAVPSEWSSHFAWELPG